MGFVYHPSVTLHGVSFYKCMDSVTAPRVLRRGMSAALSCCTSLDCFFKPNTSDVRVSGVRCPSHGMIRQYTVVHSFKSGAGRILSV